MFVIDGQIKKYKYIWMRQKLSEIKWIEVDWISIDQVRMTWKHFRRKMIG